MDHKQKEIIGKYKKLKLELGYAPTVKEFYKIIPRRKCEDSFPKNTYSAIQIAAGDEPRKFVKEGRSEDRFYEIYGKAIRDDIEHIPTVAEWSSRKLKPTVDGYRKKLKIKWSQMPLAFIDWAISNPEWEYVVNICDIHCKENNLYPEKTETLTPSFGYVYLIKANKKGHYKIGKTDSTGRRASQLSQLDLHDRKYEHVLETTDPFGLENYWKRRFKNKRIKADKEIFELSPGDLKVFKEFYVKEAPKTY